MLKKKAIFVHIAELPLPFCSNDLYILYSTLLHSKRKCKNVIKIFVILLFYL